jgi:hypothetical protein
VDTPSESAKELHDRKKKKTKVAKTSQADGKNDAKQNDGDVNKNVKKQVDANDVRLFGGSTPSLMVSPQPYPFYYHPYIYPRQLSPPSTLSTPLLWPPQPPPQTLHSPTLPTRYSNRRRVPANDSSSQDPSRSKPSKDETEEHYWIV